MKRFILVSVLSLVFLFGVLHFIDAKSNPTASLFSKNVGMPMNAQQMTSFLRQVAGQNLANIPQGPPLSPAGIPEIVHHVRGNFNPGGQIFLDVQAPPTLANSPFLVILSFSGDYPGIDLQQFGLGDHLPLNPPYPAIYSGILDSSGHGSLPLQIPLDTRLCGVGLSTAIGILTPFSQQFTFSNPISFAICTGVVGNSCCTQGVLGSPDAQCIDGGVSVDYCRLTTGGAVQTCIPDEPQNASLGLNISTLVPANLTTVNTTLINNVLRDVANSNISSNNYTPGRYICHHFADDLEQYLQNHGYNATFTHFMQFDNNNRTINDHALTDVHFGDGSILFIEPQTGRIVDLDIDRDGHVGARMYPPMHQNGYHPTDDNAKITVYESKAAAVAAGLNMP